MAVAGATAGSVVWMTSSRPAARQGPALSACPEGPQEPQKGHITFHPQAVQGLWGHRVGATGSKVQAWGGTPIATSSSFCTPTWVRRGLCQHKPRPRAPWDTPRDAPYPAPLEAPGPRPATCLSDALTAADPAERSRGPRRAQRCGRIRPGLALGGGHQRSRRSS